MKNLGQIVVFSIILSLSFQFGISASTSFIEKEKKELSEGMDSPSKEEDTEGFDLKSQFMFLVSLILIEKPQRESYVNDRGFIVLAGFIKNSFQPPEVVC